MIGRRTLLKAAAAFPAIVPASVFGLGWIDPAGSDGPGIVSP